MEPKGATGITTAAARLDRSLREQAAEWYAGISIGHDGRLVVRIVPTPERPGYGVMKRLVDAHVEASGQPLDIRAAVWAIQELESAATCVAAAVGDHPDLALSRWGLDIEANRVRIGYVGDAANMAMVLEQLGYNDSIIVAEQDTGFSQAF